MREARWNRMRCCCHWSSKPQAYRPLPHGWLPALFLTDPLPPLLPHSPSYNDQHYRLARVKEEYRETAKEQVHGRDSHRGGAHSRKDADRRRGQHGKTTNTREVFRTRERLVWPAFDSLLEMAPVEAALLLEEVAPIWVLQPTAGVAGVDAGANRGAARVPSGASAGKPPQLAPTPTLSDSAARTSGFKPNRITFGGAPLPSTAASTGVGKGKFAIPSQSGLVAEEEHRRRELLERRQSRDHASSAASPTSPTSASATITAPTSAAAAAAAAATASMAPMLRFAAVQNRRGTSDLLHLPGPFLRRLPLAFLSKWVNGGSSGLAGRSGCGGAGGRVKLLLATDALGDFAHSVLWDAVYSACILSIQTLATNQPSDQRFGAARCSARRVHVHVHHHPLWCS
jgi:hypothetical protein